MFNYAELRAISNLKLYTNYILLVFCVATCAQTPAIISTSGYIPPGFEGINNDYTGSVLILLGVDPIGAAEIEFKDIFPVFQ